jgi:hypothetical protein
MPQIQASIPLSSALLFHLLPTHGMLTSALLVLAIAGSAWRRRYILFPFTVFFLISTLPSALAHDMNNATRNTSEHIDLIVSRNLGRGISLSSPSIWTLVPSLLTLAIVGSMWRRRYVLFIASLSNLPNIFAQSTNTLTVSPWTMSRKGVDPTLLTQAASTSDLSKWLFGLLVLFLVLPGISSRRNPWLLQLALLMELPVALAQDLNATKLSEHKGVDPHAFHGGSISHKLDNWMLLVPLLGFMVVGNLNIRRFTGVTGVYVDSLGSLLPIVLAEATNISAITEHKGAGPIISGATTVANLVPWAFVVCLLSLFLLGQIKPDYFSPGHT